MSLTTTTSQCGGASVPIQNQEFKDYIKYRPFSVDRLNINVGGRPVAGIPYLRNGWVPFDSRTRLSRDMALSRGVQDSNSRLGEAEPSLPRMSYMDGGQSGGGLKAHHFGLQDGGGQSGAGLFDQVMKMVKQQVIKQVKPAVDTVKFLGEHVKEGDLAETIGEKLSQAVKLAEHEIEKSGKDIEKSAKRGTIVSDGLRFISNIADKYGGEIASKAASKMAKAVGLGPIGEKLTEQLSEMLIKKTGVDKVASKAVKSLSNKAKQAGLGLEKRFHNTNPVGHDRSKVGRPLPHYRPYSSQALTTGDESNRGPRGFDAQSFVATHPLNFRRATLNDVA